MSDRTVFGTFSKREKQDVKVFRVLCRFVKKVRVLYLFRLTTFLNSIFLYSCIPHYESNSFVSLKCFLSLPKVTLVITRKKSRRMLHSLTGKKALSFL